MAGAKVQPWGVSQDQRRDRECSASKQTGVSRWCRRLRVVMRRGRPKSLLGSCSGVWCPSAVAVAVARSQRPRSVRPFPLQCLRLRAAMLLASAGQVMFGCCFTMPKPEGDEPVPACLICTDCQIQSRNRPIISAPASSRRQLQIFAHPSSVFRERHLQHLHQHLPNYQRPL